MTFDSSDFQAAMYEVLETSRYDVLMGRRVRFQEVIVERITDWLYRFMSRFNFDTTPATANATRGIMSTTFVIIGIILAIVAVYFLYRSYRSRIVDRKYDLSDIFEELANKNYTVADLLNLSKNATERRLSIRYLYIATILALNEHNIIDIKPSATNAIISRQVRNGAPSLLPHFKGVADAFHLAWFGYKNVPDDIFDNVHNQVIIITTYEGGDVL